MTKQVSQIILFLIWPFLAFVLWMRRVGQNHSFFILGAFVVYSCTTQAVITKSSDIVKQRVYYERFVQANLSFGEYFGQLFNTETYVRFKNFDVVESGTWFLLSLFNASTFWLDLAMGLLFALLFTFNLKSIQGHLQKINSKSSYILIAFFFFIAPFWLITGFRFHYATLLAFTAFIQYYLLDNKKLGLIFWFLAPLAHFGYWFIVPVPFIFHALRKFRWVALSFAVSMNLLGSSDLFKTLINAGKAYVPQALYSQGEDYVTEGKIESSAININKGKSFHAAYYQEAAHLFILLASLLFFMHLNLTYKGSFFTKKLKYHLNIVLLLSGLIGLLNTIPGAKRFEVLEQMMFWIFFVTYLTERLKLNRFFTLPLFLKAISPLAFFWLIVEFRKVFDLFSVSTILGNPFVAFALNDVALIDLIK